MRESLLGRGHRALWMYLLCDEAKKKGLDSKEYAPDAIRRCGLYQGGKSAKEGRRQGLAEGAEENVVFEVCTVGF
ncbi:hypothetical protein [Bariatricus sp. HCP28S3_C2]|uniref:hypothetical protein n=1 Tax=unclassified Bariatricus TaxID=2677046 RepID=UPI003F8988E0